MVVALSKVSATNLCLTRLARAPAGTSVSLLTVSILAALAGACGGEPHPGPSDAVDAGYGGVDARSTVDAATTDAVAEAVGGDASLDAAASCSPPNLVCSGACVPSNVHHCGSCTLDCTDLSHVTGTTSCTTDGACAFEPSACAAGWGDCDGDPDNGCETDLSQPDHCGSCSTTCPSTDPVCAPSGSSFSCATGCGAQAPTLCGGSCVDTTTSVSNCGQCAHTCAGVTNGQAICTDSQCGFTCNQGFAACPTGAPTACVDETSDGANCGGCGIACGDGEACVGGVCQCPAGEHVCAAACVQNDVDACGVSCAVCAAPTNGAATCDGTSCGMSCPDASAPTLCGSTCVDTSADSANCGGCGAACPAGQQCTGGECAITVTGYTVNQNTLPPFAPVPNRQVAILDAAGHRSVVTSDSTGAFSVAGVVPPYDALVYPATDAPPPTSPGDGPAAYLSLSTPEPALGAWVSTTASPSTWHSATINVPVSFACASTSCPINVAVSSTDAQSMSGGLTSVLSPTTPSPFTWNLSVQWLGSATVTASIHVLASDATYTHYWYVEVDQAVTDTQTVTLGTVTPSAIPTLGTLTVTVDPVGIPSSWATPNTYVWLAWGTSTAAGLPNVASTSVVIGVPDIVGATLGAETYATSADVAGFVSQTGAYAQNVPISATSLNLTLTAPPVITSPVSQGTLSSSGSITWTAISTTEMYYLWFWQPTDGGVLAEGQIATSGSSVDLARLATLGMTLSPGLTRLEMDGMGAVSSLSSAVDVKSTAPWGDGTEESGNAIDFTVTP